MKFSQNGYDFTDEEFPANSLSAYCKERGLKDTLVLLASNPTTKHKTIVIYKDGMPIYDDTTFEGIACHIDMMALAEDIK